MGAGAIPIWVSWPAEIVNQKQYYNPQGLAEVGASLTGLKDLGRGGPHQSGPWKIRQILKVNSEVPQTQPRRTQIPAAAPGTHLCSGRLAHGAQPSLWLTHFFPFLL